MTERVFAEINETVKTTLALPNDAIITKATKFVRFDWRSLMAYFEKEVIGLEAPYCIIRPGPSEPAEWGMSNHCLYIPIEIFYIDNERNRVNTTLSTINSPTEIVVADDSFMFVDQRLYFATTNEYGFVSALPGANVVQLSAAITPTVGEIIRSDITSDVEVKIEKLRTVFIQGVEYDTFQLMEDPLTDVSDLNPVNDHMGPDNYTLFAGSCFFKPLVGETP
jgi:hypothetical protein